MSSYGFNANEVPNSDPGDSFGPVPAGVYDATLEAVEIRQSKAGGEFFNVKWRINGPAHANRVIFDIINWRVPHSAKAEGIGRETLAKASKALGHPVFHHPTELCGRNCQIRVAVRPPRDGYDADNRVVAYIPYGQQGPPQARPQGGGYSAPQQRPPQGYGQQQASHFGPDDTPF